jgi:hypothetical protein
LLEIEHNPQIIVPAPRIAQTDDRRILGRRQIQLAARHGTGKIDHHPIGVLELQ